jgi:hypothetical protein
VRTQPLSQAIVTPVIGCGSTDRGRIGRVGLLAGLGTIAAICTTSDCTIRATPEQAKLVRFGLEPETADKLGADAARAEAAVLMHGVSVRSATNRLDASWAFRAEVERVFRVVKTGGDPKHFTVVLPKPVTSKAASTSTSYLIDWARLREPRRSTDRWRVGSHGDRGAAPGLHPAPGRGGNNRGTQGASDPSVIGK